MSPEQFLNQFKNLEKTGEFRQARTLDRVLELLGRLGDPHKKLPPAIIIAGSKGKGSTATLTSSILGAAGLRTGLYTSPHIVRWNERIVAEGQEITDGEAAVLIDRYGPVFLQPTSNGETATYFEVVTALAFLYFAERALDAVVLEVGLGGTYDAVNVCDAPVAVITQLGLEHQFILGDTLAQIAREKAGVMRRDQITILEHQPLEAAAALWAAAEEIGAKKIDAGRWEIETGETGGDFQEFSMMAGSVEFGPLRLRLLGSHQLRNARLATLAAFAFGEKTGRILPDEAIARGLFGVKIPVRMELLDVGPNRQSWLIDGAHNRESAAALAMGIQKHFEGRPVRLIVGMMRDKDPENFLEELKPLGPVELIAVGVHSERAWSARELAGRWRASGIPVREAAYWPEAEAMMREALKPDDLAVVTGSLYLAGEARKSLKPAGVV